MKINKEDLPFLDLIWFAVDRFNKVIELTSGGSAILPDFIIKSVEDVEFLEKYFFDEFKSFTKIQYYYDYGGGSHRKNQKIDKYGEPQEIQHIKKKRYEQLLKIPIFNESVDLTSKGIYCFDACPRDPNGPLINSYRIVAEPKVPLILSDLKDDNVKRILSNQRLNVDVTTQNIIFI